MRIEEEKQSKHLKPSETMKKRKQLQGQTYLPPSPPLPELPSEVIVDILSRLPLDALFRFRCVCKSWYHLVRDPGFIKMQANRAIEKPKILIAYSKNISCLEFESRDRIDSVVIRHPPCEEPILFPDTCNGLVCYTVDRLREIYLWNPFTGDNKRLPDVPTPSACRGNFFIGYSPAMDEYKVVMISLHCDQGVWVHTLGTQSWRWVECSRSRIFPFWNVVCLNGALHWIVFPTPSKTSNAIIVFDLVDEKFMEMLLPDFGNTNFCLPTLMPGEHLCVHCYSFDGDFWEIWVMNEYGNEKSWIKKFSQTQTNVVEMSQIWGSLKTGEILQERNNQFVLYRLVDKRTKKLPIRGTLDFAKVVYNYVETLVWPMGDV